MIHYNYKQLTLNLLLASVLISSCKKLIEIPANPATAITQAQQFADSATTMSAIAGIYTYSLYGQGFAYNDGILTACTGLSSDELSTTISYTPDYQEFYQYGVTSLNSTVGNLWSSPYTGLYPVNAALQEIAASSGLSTSFKTEITAELKVVRALYYFNLVNLFGPVPLVRSTDFKKTSVLPRSSVDSIYGQVVSDLTDAQHGLQADYPSSGRVRPNLYTDLSLLAKVHLYRKEWQKAYDAANTVIGSGQYSLESDLNNVFLEGSSEAIWQLPANDPNSTALTAEATNFIPYSSGTVPSYLVTPMLLNAFEPGDQRQQDWLTDIVVNIDGVDKDFYIPYKYKIRDVSTASTTEDYMIFRLGELYLIRAEAAAQLGNISDALADVNEIRGRAGLSASTASTQEDVLNAIQHERQIELFCEWGNRWYDLKRTGAIDSVLSAEKTGWKPTAALYPVPRAQIAFNPFLTQNPGYN